MLKLILSGFSIIFLLFVAGAYIWVIHGDNLNSIMSRFNKPNYERWVSQFDSFEIKQEDIVFLGDSLTEWGNWDEIFSDYHVRNRGIAGDDSQGVLNRLDAIIKGHPRKIFLMIGTNDLFGGVETNVIIRNIIEIVDRVNEESEQTEIYVQSLLPRRPSYTKRIIHFNEQLKSEISHKAIWVDLFPYFLSDDGTKINPKYSNDKLHLMANGYQMWANTIKVHMGAPTRLHMEAASVNLDLETSL